MSGDKRFIRFPEIVHSATDGGERLTQSERGNGQLNILLLTPPEDLLRRMCLSLLQRDLDDEIGLDVDDQRGTSVDTRAALMSSMNPAVLRESSGSSVGGSAR
jgi:hypothetical protein